MLWVQILLFLVWLLMIGLPALAAFGFQLFACNASKSVWIRMIPTVLVLAIIIYECIHPFYGVYLYLISAMLGLTHYLIIPAVLIALLAGWLVKAERSD